MERNGAAGWRLYKARSGAVNERARPEAGFGCGDNRAKGRAHARADDTDAVRIHFRSRAQSFHDCMAGLDPVWHDDMNSVHRSFAMTEPFEGQYRDAALQPPVALHGDGGFLEAVNTRNRPVRRKRPPS